MVMFVSSLQGQGKGERSRKWDQYHLALHLLVGQELQLLRALGPAAHLQIIATIKSDIIKPLLISLPAVAWEQCCQMLSTNKTILEGLTATWQEWVLKGKRA